MLDLVIRNARLPTAADGRLVDIGFAGGRIAAIEPQLAADAPALRRRRVASAAQA